MSQLSTAFHHIYFLEVVSTQISRYLFTNPLRGMPSEYLDKEMWVSKSEAKGQFFLSERELQPLCCRRRGVFREFKLREIADAVKQKLIEENMIGSDFMGNLFRLRAARVAERTKRNADRITKRKVKREAQLRSAMIQNGLQYNDMDPLCQEYIFSQRDDLYFIVGRLVVERRRTYCPTCTVQ